MPWKKSGPMEQRTEFALRAMQTLNFRALCQQYGISTKTGYKWKERFWRKGLAGMEEESRRPKSHSKQLPEGEVCEIVRLKLAHLAWGPRKIRELYLRGHGEVASESTFKRVLERTSLKQKRRRRRAPEAGRLSSGRQAATLNEVWTVDFKGWWRKADLSRTLLNVLSLATSPCPRKYNSRILRGPQAICASFKRTISHTSSSGSCLEWLFGRRDSSAIPAKPLRQKRSLHLYPVLVLIPYC